MKLRSKIKLLTLLTIFIVFSILFFRYIVKAVNVSLDDIKDNKYDFTISYQKDVKSDVIHKEKNIEGITYNIFCREKDGSLYGNSKGNPIYYYKKTSKNRYITKSSSENERKLAKLLWECEGDTYKQQRVIWASQANTGTEVEYYKWNNTTVGEYIKPEITIKSSKAKSELDGDNYKIGPIQVDYKGGTNGEAFLSDVIEIIDADTDEIKGNITYIGEIEKNKDFYINVPKNILNDIKKIKIKMEVTGYWYYVDCINYIGTGYVGENAVDSSGQKLIAIHTDEDYEKDDDTSEVIKLATPRLITTKYITNIEHQDKIIWNNTTGPSVTVDTSKEVTAKGRYNLTKQNTNNINLAYGDIITYKIRVYNVGDGDADLTSDESDSQKMADGTSRKIISNGYVYDYYSSNLEFAGNADIWEKEGNIMKASVKKAFNNTTIGACVSQNPNFVDVDIKFKVTGDKNATKIEVTNNDSKTQRDDSAHLKFLYKITTKNAKGETIEKKLTEPSVSVNTNVAVGKEGRFTYNLNASNPTVMNGDILTYCIRYYSIGENTTCLTYDLEDKFGNGLIYKSASGGNVSNNRNNTLTINAPNELLDGYTGNSVLYYDIYLEFEVKVNPQNIAYVQNSISGTIPPPPSRQRTGYEIKGKVFIDKEKLSEEGKILNPRNALLDEGTDGIAKKVKVELLYTNGNNVADIWINGTPYIQDKATEELYPTTVYTNDKGEYTFTHLPAREITIDSEGNIVGNEDISTPYRIRFTYNGQEYENVEYNKDTYAGKGSYATEGNKNRADFNSKFTTINSTNSEKYTLKPKENKSVAEGKGPNGEYNISSYTGSSGWNSNNGIINVDTTYKENVNLGLVKRDFDLDLTNRLVSMDISINDVKQTLNNINNNGISKELENQDVYFKESDYNYTNESNSNKELNVWVNYEITIKNSTIDKFNGILNNINLYYDERFDDIEIPPELGRTEISGVAGFKGVNINFGSEGKIISTNADNAYKIKIRLHLNRQTIADALKNNNESMITFNTIAEIASYGSTYNGDIYKNGHGVNNPNAGKIDEDSNAGSFKIDEYAYSDKDGKIEILKEDDTSRAIGIQLKKDGSSRTLSGIVFEDVTEQRNVGNSNSKTRLGNGEYNQEDNDKKIQNVTVELYEIDDQIPMEVYNGTEWKESTVKSNQNGEYKISGFIPSNNYVVKFTYGDGSTDIYNAQDYKSTIDKTSNDYDATKAIDENGYSTGEGNYWYRDENIKRKSIAKDEDTRMTTNNYGIEGTLTNSSAINLEDYQNVINDEKIFKNTATTARFCVPIRSDGNKNSNADKYEISNINLGLAERPRSELTIEKTVDHVSITATDGSPIVDGTQGAKGISWTDRYVQPIVDENLIYGSKLTVTYKIKVTNTGEVDYNPGEDKLDENNKSSKTGTRKFYDYGIKREDKDIITTKADQVIDYTDNNLTYDKNEKAAPNVKDNDNVNSNYWLEATDIDSYLDEDTKTYYNTVTTKLITEELNQNLKPGDSSKEVYLTQTKILSQNDVNDQMAYDNYVEIIESTNDAGRRNYHTTEISSDGITLSANYNNVLLSDVENRGTPVKEHMTSENDKYLVLSIPGDLGDPKDTTTTTLNFEPDSSAAQNIQIVQPFGDEKNYNITILAIIITTSGLILAGGIYLIKKKVL